MKIVWAPEAEADRSAIWHYLEERDPAAAVRMDQRFADAVARLADFPMLGHEGAVADTRELTPHRSYRIVYEVVDESSASWC